MKRFIVPAALLLAAASLILSSQRAQAVQPPAEPVVATVDLGVIYDQWEEVKTFTDSMEDDKHTQEEELEKLEAKIRDKQIAANGLEAGSKDRQKLEEEISGLRAKHTKKMENWNTGVQKKLNDGIAGFYHRILEEVAAYSKEEGISLVLKQNAEKIKPERASEEIANRGVLYCDPSMDITATILKRLNGK
jgi:Skp family chaperone for outer membrane proteins